MRGPRIVLGNSSLAGYPQAGGLWALFLQYFVGLRDLGADVYWLELVTKSGDRARDELLLGVFFDRMRAYGLEDRTMVLVRESEAAPWALGSCRVLGKTELETTEIVESCDLLWNFACALRHPLLSRFKRRVLVDGDPGHLQISALAWNMGIDEHHAFLTVGSKIHDPECDVPTLGKTWHRFLQFVHLPMWRVEPDPGPNAPFTTVTQWNWGELWLDGRPVSIAKRDAYLRYVDLPLRSGRAFELAVNIHPNDETGDRERLASGGWALADPHEVAKTPADYQSYIARSRAEISCPKPIYRELKTGWFSDRSAGYLASGRPVLAEETGLGDALPTGKGLLTFRDMGEALAGVKEIDGNYAGHSRAARALAEDLLASTRWLPAMLEACA